MKRVVLISSMGGTDENNPLNRLGGGRVLVWKRVAEDYLIDSKAFTYTILHPGGLTDEEVGHTVYDLTAHAHPGSKSCGSSLVAPAVQAHPCFRDKGLSE